MKNRLCLLLTGVFVFLSCVFPACISLAQHSRNNPVYVNRAFKFQINPPEGWIVADSDKSQKIFNELEGKRRQNKKIITACYFLFDTPSNLPRVLVKRDFTNLHSIPIDQFAYKINRSRKYKYHAEVISVAGRRAVVFEEPLLLTMPGNKKLRVTSRNYLFFVVNRLYVISVYYRGQQFENYKAVIEKMLHSFRVIW